MCVPECSIITSVPEAPDPGDDVECPKCGHAFPAPDLDDEQVDAIAAVALTHKVDGLIATNTTVSREEIAGHPRAVEAGGLSGKPLLARSTGVLAKLSNALGARVPLVGVGGILSGEDARAKITAGASLVQVYTGFIYRGPALIAEARKALR